MVLPQIFKDQLSSHFESSIVDRVLDGLQQNPSTSIRKNSRKQPHEFIGHKPIPWSQNGMILSERPLFHHDPHLHAGAYYVQDSSSMILEAVLKTLDLPGDPLFLDACAAPGGKSTILLDHLNGHGFVIANEIDGKRNSILQENLLKWGQVNHAITSLRADQWRKIPLRFDLILVDAPCSGEGMFRKDSFALEQWNRKLVEQCSLTQQNLLSDLDESLRTDGYLIYATCTMNAKENEQQVLKLVESGRFELATPELSLYREHLTTVEHQGKTLGHYLLPGIALGEGLFIAVLRKTAPTPIGKLRKKSQPIKTEAFSQEMLDTFQIKNSEGLALIRNGNELSMIPQHAQMDMLEIPLRRMGLPAFELKGKNLIPKHGLAMGELLSNAIPLDLQDSLQYLKKESFSLPTQVEKGWKVVAHNNRQLGWVKELDNRTNNYYPGWIRLRN